MVGGWRDAWQLTGSVEGPYLSSAGSSATSAPITPPLGFGKTAHHSNPLSLIDNSLQTPPRRAMGQCRYNGCTARGQSQCERARGQVAALYEDRSNDYSKSEKLGYSAPISLDALLLPHLKLPLILHQNTNMTSIHGFYRRLKSACARDYHYPHSSGRLHSPFLDHP